MGCHPILFRGELCSQPRLQGPGSRSPHLDGGAVLVYWGVSTGGMVAPTARHLPIWLVLLSSPSGPKVYVYELCLFLLKFVSRYFHFFFSIFFYRRGTQGLLHCVFCFCVFTWRCAHWPCPLAAWMYSRALCLSGH